MTKYLLGALLAITMTGCCNQKPFWHRQYSTYGSPDELVTLDEELITPNGETLGWVYGPVSGSKMVEMNSEQILWRAVGRLGELTTINQKLAEEFVEKP